ncbi:MAG: hypothetical protein FDZ70_09740 [Actinobacteria bacterium]|nr:MAG: hypothetical protein FDZ70_09740 [Actinomycetota bacterium]
MGETVRANASGWRFAALAVLLLCAMTLSQYGCARGPAAPLTVATTLWPGNEPLFLASEMGYYGDTDVRLMELPSTSAVVDAFAKGRVDGATATLDEALQYLEEHDDMRVVVVLDTSNGGDVVMARPEITELKGLRGRKVAVEGTALGAFVLSRALESAGMQPGDVEPVYLAMDEHLQAYTPAGSTPS